MKRLIVLAVLVMGFCVMFSGLALAKDTSYATIELTQGQVGLGIGYSWGEGVLKYNGKKYPVKVTGLSVIDVGITKASAKGQVFGLKNLEDFDGIYTSATAEGTVGGGAGATAMKNQNGVVIHLITTTKGVNVKLAPSGVELKLKK
jgi:hypothetical protein